MVDKYIVDNNPKRFSAFSEHLILGKRLTRHWYNDKKYLRFINGELYVVDAFWDIEGNWIAKKDFYTLVDLTEYNFNEFGYIDWIPWEWEDNIPTVYGVDSTVHHDIVDTFDHFDDFFIVKNNRVLIR